MPPESLKARARSAAPRAEGVRPSLLEGLDAGAPDGEGAAPGAAERKAQRPGGPDRAPRRRHARNLALAGLAAAVVIVVWQLIGGSGPDLAAASRARTLIDAESGEVFEDHRVPAGATFPLMNPRTSRPTLFPAERCYWTPEGDAKWAPTFVFVPPDQPSARCPDCGREVIPHNPRPPEAQMLEALRRHREGR